jgi:hypothetical protein
MRDEFFLLFIPHPSSLIPSQWRDRARFSLDFPLNPKRFTMKKNVNPALKAYANLLLTDERQVSTDKGKMSKTEFSC